MRKAKNHPNPTILPLDKPEGFDRKIQITSCLLDTEHLQIRGQLTDTRQNFEDAEEPIPVHDIVVRLTVRLADNIITKAEFGLPLMAFENMCEKLPYGPEKLEGISMFKGFSAKVREYYGGKKSCFHLASLLQAMAPAMSQCRSWNSDFKFADERLPGDQVEVLMDGMLASAKNSCHAWEEENGGITVDFKHKAYERMLNRATPRLLGRWKQK